MQGRRILHRILILLEKVKLDSLALQIYDGTLFSNLAAYARLSGGMKLPPVNLMRVVASTTDYNRFVWSGRLTVSRILDLLQASGIEFSKLENILDFGCGCGRLTRFFLMLDSCKGSRKVYGSDTEAEHIKYCRANMPHGTFVVNGTSPVLSFADGQFDMVVSYSVFTHIKAEKQLGWFKELGRVIRPGGVLIFSTHATDAIYSQKNIPPEQTERYKKGEIISVAADMRYMSQSNYGIFHPPGVVSKLAVASGIFDHRLTFTGLEAPPMDSAGHDLHLWCRSSIKYDTEDNGRTHYLNP